MTANESHPWHGRLLMVVVMTPLVLFLPVLLAGKALFWGTPMLQFMPWWDLAWDQLGTGSLPLWNNLSGMGAPLLANCQSALFYPPPWIYLLTYLAGGRLLMPWSLGMLTINGNYMQTSRGLLRMEIGSSYDVLSISGLASLGGTLDISLLSGFNPTEGQSFDLVRYTNREGSFANIAGLDPEGLSTLHMITETAVGSVRLLSQLIIVAAILFPCHPP